MSRADLALIRQDYDGYHRQEDGRGEAELTGPVLVLALTGCLIRTCYGLGSWRGRAYRVSIGIDFVALFDKDLLWT